MGTSFKTSDGREWPLKITFDSAAKIKVAHSVDLMSVKDIFTEIGKLSEDRIKFVESLWIIASDGLTDADKPALRKLFTAGMDGEAMDAAEAAFEEALLVFSPPRLRDTVAKVFAANRKLGPAAADRIEKKFLTDDRINAALDKAMEAAQSQMDGPGSSGPGSAPASSGSSPAPEVSGN